MIVGSVVPDGSVVVCGKVRVTEPVNGVLGTGDIASGVTGTGGPIFEAGAVGSAAAGKPGVCACTTAAPASSAIAAVKNLIDVMSISSFKAHRAYRHARGQAPPACRVRQVVS